jgi:Abnormal spindle-like microcephaly-assoc'd, ASPM-SPD-2-Hydin
LAPAGLIPTPLGLTFPAQDVGTTSAEKTIMVANVSPNAVTVSNIATTGDFTSPTQTLAAKANCAIFITFDPSSKGAQTGTLSVTDDAPGSPQMVNLKGTGTK